LSESDDNNVSKLSPNITDDIDISNKYDYGKNDGNNNQRRNTDTNKNIKKLSSLAI
jgi:hypothetical protein